VADTGKIVAGAAAATLFGVYADLAYNTYSATNSSPQTTELFAGEREQTLWKYVVVGHVQAVVIGLFGTILARKIWPLFGTLSVGVIMHCMYAHAVKKGKDQAPPASSDDTARRNVGRPR
jgi:hypothetical protein